MNRNHKINPRNEKEVRQIQAVSLAADILEEKFKLQERGLSIQVQRQTGWSGSDAWHCGMYQDEERQIKINLRNLEGASLATIIEVLGHEFRHTLQYAVGILDRRYHWTGPTHSDKFVAPNVSYDDVHYRTWFHKPWEIDARMFQKAYAQFVFNDPRFAEFTPYLAEYVGKKPMKEDRAANYAATGFSKNEIQVMRLRSGEKGMLYWFSLSQLNERLPKPAKKITQKHINLMASAEHVEFLKSQLFNKHFIEVEIDDLVS